MVSVIETPRDPAIATPYGAGGSIRPLGEYAQLPIVRPPTPSKVLVCYISSSAHSRSGRGAYSIENFDPSLCTHAIYAFASLDIENAAIKPLNTLADISTPKQKGNYNRLTAMKRKHPHLKVSLAIGGSKDESKNFSIIADDPVLRRNFVIQASEFLRKHNFDGLDIDWEFPTQNGGMPCDRQNFVALIKELHQEFNSRKLLLTAAISASREVIKEAYDAEQLSLYLDYFHVMCYDYAGSWDKRIGFNAPLVAPYGKKSVQDTIAYLLELGIPKQKLVLGLPFYGRTFTTYGKGAVGEITDGSCFQGPYTNENGFMGYNEIYAELRKNPSDWTVGWDAAASQAIARSIRDPVTGQVRVVTFDDKRSISNKVKYALAKELGGVMIWSVDTDDFLGESGTKYPLLRKAKRILY